MKFIAINEDNEGFCFEADTQEIAEATVVPLFAKNGMVLAELKNESEGTTTLYGNSAVKWSYS